MKSILVTGGAGFIGSNFVIYWLKKYPNDRLVILDDLTYAGNVINISSYMDSHSKFFVRGNICDEKLLEELFTTHRFDTVVHFAAESHVDKSIASPEAFIKTNIEGTFKLLAVALKFWKDSFTNKRFHHVSTDEVYGDLGPEDPAFTEETPYAPRSPYAASKASSDLLVRAYSKTYGLPVTISNCSNNYGQYQFPEKLIPLTLIHALTGKQLPVYGKGQNIRDWLFVGDHCRAIDLILSHGQEGETYNVGGENEIRNIDLVIELCRHLEKKFAADRTLAERFPECPAASGKKIESLISFVADRPGHDRRYAINQDKIRKKLSFQPSVDFSEGLDQTIDWYLSNDNWWKSILTGEHQKWLESHYGNRQKVI